MPTASKTILITGASSGFGLLATRRLLSRGHCVIAAMRGGETRLRDLFAEELKTSGSRLQTVDLHLDRPESFELARKYVEKEHGNRLDILINNAGYGVFGAIVDLSDAEIKKQMEVNFFAPIALTRALFPALQAARGRVLNVSSIAGLYTFPSYGMYAASKHALEAVSEGMYYDFKPFGVQVCLIEPGGFRTNFTERSREYATGPVGGARTEALLRFFAKVNHTLADPDRVARLMVSLCERGHIPLRAPVGTDAHALRFLYWLLPRAVITAAQDFFFRRIVYRS